MKYLYTNLNVHALLVKKEKGIMLYVYFCCLLFFDYKCILNIFSVNNSDLEHDF